MADRNIIFRRKVYDSMLKWKIAQMLRATGKRLYYHTIPFENGKKYYGVDFLIADGYKVSPIEVKSSSYKTHASLDRFCNKYSARIQNRYLIYTKDLQCEGNNRSSSPNSLNR